MRHLAVATIYAVVALTRGEAWLLRGAVLLFAVTVGLCVWILMKVQDAERAATAANEQATALAKRTAALEAKIADRE